MSDITTLDKNVIQVVDTWAVDAPVTILIDNQRVLLTTAEALQIANMLTEAASSAMITEHSYLSNVIAEQQRNITSLEGLDILNDDTEEGETDGSV